MQLLTKLTLVAVVLTALGTSATFADDQRLQNRLACEQSQNSLHVEPTTVAVYANHRGIGRAEATASDSQRYELRSNGHGQLTGGWVEGR